ncbi:14320_t:CDS:1 [Acaulospora morrowiae]|uniref:14320_t:CDS:1 n=1 Tax=Acaulospora morrowiae TaxID=94023 RepID=A0A9N8VAJ5_9GLOM|nr:14320_t:CDS:1 [Acaulospora morrowiae]
MNATIFPDNHSGSPDSLVFDDFERENSQASSSVTISESGLNSGPSNINGLLGDEKALNRINLCRELCGDGEGSNVDEFTSKSTNSFSILNVPSNTPTNFAPEMNSEEEISKINNALKNMDGISDKEMENKVEKEGEVIEDKKSFFVNMKKIIKKILKGKCKKR